MSESGQSPSCRPASRHRRPAFLTGQKAPILEVGAFPGSLVRRSDYAGCRGFSRNLASLSPPATPSSPNTWAIPAIGVRAVGVRSIGIAISVGSVIRVRVRRVPIAVGIGSVIGIASTATLDIQFVSRFLGGHAEPRRGRHSHGLRRRWGDKSCAGNCDRCRAVGKPVSYTHLTLPTILRV